MKGKQNISSVRLINEATTAPTTSERHTPGFNEKRSFQVTGQTSAGAGSVTVQIHVSNVDVPSVDGHWITAGTIVVALSTTVATDGFTTDAAWRHVRARITAISGTGAAASVWMGA